MIFYQSLFLKLLISFCKAENIVISLNSIYTILLTITVSKFQPFFFFVLYCLTFNKKS